MGGAREEVVGVVVGGVGEAGTLRGRGGVGDDGGVLGGAEEGEFAG